MEYIHKLIHVHNTVVLCSQLHLGIVMFKRLLWTHIHIHIVTGTGVFYSCSDCKILVTMVLSYMLDNHAMHKHSNKLFVLSLYETCSLFKINSLRFHVHSKLLADHLCHGLLHLRLSHVHRSRQELCKVHVRIFFVILGKQCD